MKDGGGVGSERQRLVIRGLNHDGLAIGADGRHLRIDHRNFAIGFVRGLGGDGDGSEREHRIDGVVRRDYWRLESEGLRNLQIQRQRHRGAGDLDRIGKIYGGGAGAFRAKPLGKSVAEECVRSKRLSAKGATENGDDCGGVGVAGNAGGGQRSGNAVEVHPLTQRTEALRVGEYGDGSTFRIHQGDGVDQHFKRKYLIVRGAGAQHHYLSVSAGRSAARFDPEPPQPVSRTRENASEKAKRTRVDGCWEKRTHGLLS